MYARRSRVYSYGVTSALAVLQGLVNVVLDSLQIVSGVMEAEFTQPHPGKSSEAESTSGKSLVP